MKYRLLDLFCGAGGAAMGYHRAGFEVVGVDIKPQPHYPFEFHQADAMTYPLEGFDVIHASPPCQDHMRSACKVHGTGWMLSGIRERLEKSNLLFIIENVPGAKMRIDIDLCGCIFGLRVLRRRWFEVNWNCFNLLAPCAHIGQYLSVVGNGTPTAILNKGFRQTVKLCRDAMGIDWMTRAELSQAIPPAYTLWIGKQLMKYLTARSPA